MKPGNRECQTRMKPTKVIFLGDGAVGKMSLLIRLVENVFPDEWLPYSDNVYHKTVVVNGKEVKTDLWKINPSEGYNTLRQLDYLNTDVVVIGFGIDNHNAFKHVEERWMPEVRLHRPDVPVMLVGTKSDLRQRLVDKRPVVPVEEGEAMAKRLGCAGYMECSALTGENAEEVLEHALSLVGRVNAVEATQSSGCRLV